MSDPDAVAKASDLARAILDATHGHSFKKTLSQFIAMLSEIPDYPARDFEEARITALREAAEQVIARTEERVDGTEDSERGRLELVEGIYEIRRVLENIYRWRQHG